MWKVAHNKLAMHPNSPRLSTHYWCARSTRSGLHDRAIPTVTAPCETRARVKLRPATVPVRGGSASCAACRVGAAPCWRDIRQLPAPGPTVRSACPRAVRPKREPHGTSPVQPRRASGRLAARRAALTVPPCASPHTQLVHSGR